MRKERTYQLQIKFYKFKSVIMNTFLFNYFLDRLSLMFIYLLLYITLNNYDSALITPPIAAEILSRATSYAIWQNKNFYHTTHIEITRPLIIIII